MERCTGCSSSSLVDDVSSGDVVCTDCGLVQEADRVYLNPAPAFAYEKDEEIWKANDGDGFRTGRVFSVCSPAERCMSRVRSEISHLAERIHATRASVESACELFSAARSSSVTRGQKRKGLMAASVYHACKLERRPRSSKDIARAFGVRRKILKKQINALATYVDVKTCDAINSLPVTIEGLLTRSLSFVSSASREKMAIRNECLKILSSVTYDEFFSSRRPSSVVSGLLLVATRRLGLDVLPSDCATSAGVSVVTTNYIAKVIRNRLCEETDHAKSA